MIGAQSDSIGTDAGGSEPVAGDESKGSATQVLLPLEHYVGFPLKRKGDAAK